MRTYYFFKIIVICLFFALSGCSNEGKWESNNEGIQFTLDVVQNDGNNHTTEIARIIEKRLNEFNIKKKNIEVKGKSSIVVQVPLYEQIERVKKLIIQQGKLEIRAVVENPSKDNGSNETMPIIGATDKMTVERNILFSNKHIKNAIYRISAKYNEPYILLEFNDIGSQLFSDITEKYINKRLAIIVDQYIYTAPIIREKIVGNSAMISGDFTVEEALDLAIILKNDSFPQKVTVQNEKIIPHERWVNIE